MGYKQPLKPSTASLWNKYKREFPVTNRLVYLNHAAVSPLMMPAAAAMKQLTDEICEYGSLHFKKWLNTYEGLRISAARMIGADRGEIAIIKNTSEGISTVANGLNWRSGDKVIAFREEFPANYYPWIRLEKKGVKVQWLSITDPLEVIDAACGGARLLAISFVNYLSGHRVNLEALGEICHRHGCLFLVDAIQGMGAFPIDVGRARIDALAADGHKWLLGPEGCGILYINKYLQDSIEPIEFGWTNVANYADYGSRDMTLRPDAGRYECGTLNTVGCYGLRASIDFLLAVGVTDISESILFLANRIIDGVTRKGYEVLGSGTTDNRSGIVTFRKQDIDSRLVVSQLHKNGILTSVRQGWIRASPHFYISPDGIDRMLEALP